MVASFTVAAAENDNCVHLPTSLELEAGKKAILSWTVDNAESVELTDPAAGPRIISDGSTSLQITPAAESSEYLLVAISGEARSAPSTVHIGTHPAEQVVSPHATVTAIPGEPTTLTQDEKISIVRRIALLESGSDPFGACNCDTEFEGYFDLPEHWYRTTKTRKKTARPDEPAPKVPYSKYFDSPRHVGLSFGLIQFTQEAPLGKLVAKFKKKDPKKFAEIFGEHADDLLDTLLNSGKSKKVQEEVFDRDNKSMGKKMVSRAPSVVAVAGTELWEDPWLSRFKQSATYAPFQDCQIEEAIEAYLTPVLNKAVALKMTLAEKSIFMLYDRSVNTGPDRANKLLPELKKAKDQKKYWTDYIAALAKKDFTKTRLQSLADDKSSAWDKLYNG